MTDVFAAALTQATNLESVSNDMSLQFGGNTFSYMWGTPVERALVDLVALGLNDFDVIISPGHLWPWEIDTSSRADLRKRWRAEGIRVESLNPPALGYNLGSLVEDVRKASVAVYEHTMHLAATFGQKGVVVVPGHVSSLFPTPRRETHDRLVESIGALSVLAERLGLRLHLETHPLTSLPDAVALKAFVEGIGSASLGVAYDLSNAEFIGANQAAAIRLLGSHLTQLHISYGTRQSWRHDPLGTGTVDFASAFAGVEDIGFAGIAVLELISQNPVEAFERSLSYIRSRQ